MARQQTPQSYTDLFAQQTDAAILELIILSVPVIGGGDNDFTCYHMTNNVVDVVSSVQDGITPKTYVAFPMDITAPTDETGKISGGTFSITNVSRDLVQFIQQTATGLIVEIIWVNSKEPNVEVARWPCYRWVGVQYDAMTVSGQLSLEDYLSESYPSKRMGPANFPGLF